MEVKDLKPEDLTDIFGPTNTNVAPKSNQFSVSLEDGKGDIFSKKPVEGENKEDKPLIDKVEDKTGDDKKLEDGGEDKVIDADLLSDTTKPGRKPKYDFTDTTGYFEDRLKSGKFVKIEVDGDDGKPVTFIPRTPEEFDEVIDLQVQYQVDKKSKGAEQAWYQSKTPAWQAIAKYAELVDNPADVIPFIQGVRTIESIKDVDDGTVEGAEHIVRTRLEQKGDTPEIIQQQIDVLKQADKLVVTAKAYKPMILQEEARNLVELKRQEEQRGRVWMEDMGRIQEGAMKAIESPFYGKKLQKEEKALVYDLIGSPSEESGGFKIFSLINSLFEKGEFEKLREIALLVGKKDSFVGYVSDKAANATAATLQKKLRISTESGGGKDLSGDDDEDKPVIRRKFTANFGR